MPNLINLSGKREKNEFSQAYSLKYKGDDIFVPFPVSQNRLRVSTHKLTQHVFTKKKLRLGQKTHITYY